MIFYFLSNGNCLKVNNWKFWTLTEGPTDTRPYRMDTIYDSLWIWSGTSNPIPDAPRLQLVRTHSRRKLVLSHSSNQPKFRIYPPSHISKITNI